MTMEILDDIRNAVERSGLSLNEIDRRCGVDPAITSRLLRGGSLSLANAVKLARCLGYRLTIKRVRQGAPGTRKGK